jgi:uncharacterized membrane protein YphA (DoxX/SURF4 family)
MKIVLAGALGGVAVSLGTRACLPRRSPATAGRVRLGEDWLRAALYLLIFICLIFTGPGRFSIDRLLQIRKTKPQRADAF